MYEVCLTITEGSCEDTFCLPVFSIGGAEICAYNDCVFPGDANKDGRVNIFDALPIGLGYNTAGAARPNATISPNFQAEDGIRDQPRSRGLGDVYKRQRTFSPKTKERESG